MILHEVKRSSFSYNSDGIIVPVSVDFLQQFFFPGREQSSSTGRLVVISFFFFFFKRTMVLLWDLQTGGPNVASVLMS